MGRSGTDMLQLMYWKDRSIYSVDRKTQKVSMYLESKNADEMTRMKDKQLYTCNHYSR